jgi:hypothetical protein
MVFQPALDAPSVPPLLCRAADTFAGSNVAEIRAGTQLSAFARRSWVHLRVRGSSANAAGEPFWNNARDNDGTL